MSSETYVRGQVEWALWESFQGQRIRGKKVKKIFETRIKRLLEADKGMKTDHFQDQPKSTYAFAPAAESGESPYQAVDCFCIAVGLELLDAGFKQYDTAFLMRYTRDRLEKLFPELIANRFMLSPGLSLAEDHPEIPSYRKGNNDVVDARHFMILQKHELTAENLPTAQGRHTPPQVTQPIFCAGLEALNKHLFDLTPWGGHVVTIVELAQVAQMVNAFLKKAPEIKRGRPRSSGQALA